MTGEPKYGTKRNPNNPTFGARIAAVAAYLGGTLMPWQRQVADVALELDPRTLERGDTPSSSSPSHDRPGRAFYFAP